MSPDPLAGLRELAATYQKTNIELPLKAFDRCSNRELIELANAFLPDIIEVIQAFKLRVDFRENHRDTTQANIYMLQAYRKTIISALHKVQIKQDVTDLQQRYPTVFWKE